MLTIDFLAEITTRAGKSRTIQYLVDINTQTIINVSGVNLEKDDEFEKIYFPDAFCKTTDKNNTQIKYSVNTIGPNVLRDINFDEFSNNRNDNNPNNLSSHKIGTIEVGYGIKIIQKMAFQHIDLKNVVLGSSCEEIRYGAFAGSGIETFTSPPNLKEIRKDAFSNCRNLTSVKILFPCNFIGEMAFANCINLETIELSDDIKDIRFCAFQGCKKLKHFRWPANCPEVPNGCFNDCESLSQIDFQPLSKIVILGAFRNTSIKELNLISVISAELDSCYESDEYDIKIIKPLYGEFRIETILPF